MALPDSPTPLRIAQQVIEFVLFVCNVRNILKAAAHKRRPLWWLCFTWIVLELLLATIQLYTSQHVQTQSSTANIALLAATAVTLMCTLLSDLLAYHQIDFSVPHTQLLQSGLRINGTEPETETLIVK